MEILTKKDRKVTQCINCGIRAKTNSTYCPKCKAFGDLFVHVRRAGRCLGALR